jgi:predicted DNA-binding transcriptional regulator AlpA
MSWVRTFSLDLDGVVRTLVTLMSPRKTTREPERLHSSDVAEILGISQRTLLRKLAAGVIPEPMRDPRNNYRVWRPEEVQELYQEHLREKA